MNGDPSPNLPAPFSSSAAADKAIPTENVASPRRSGRSRVSTTMQIQGHTVLRKNNYKVKGMAYVFDEFEEDAPERAKKKPKTTKASTSSRPQTREENPAQAKRRQHNRYVEDATNRKAYFRRSFLAEKVDILRPFLEEKVANQLLNFRDTQEYRGCRENVTGRHGNGTIVRKRLPEDGKYYEGEVVGYDETNKWYKILYLDGMYEDYDDDEMKRYHKPQQQYSHKVPVTQPKMIENAILRPYQLKGLEFMVKMHEQNLAMILGDEMGLGKTIQTISLLCHLKEQEKITGPSLIVCPLSVLSSWCNEMRRWAPTLRFFQMHAPNQEEQTRQRQHLFEHATKYDVVLTTYEMVKVPPLLNFYQRTKFHYLVLDEGHKIKSHVTQISKAMRKIHTGNRLLLTGTPLQNNLVELWSLMNFLYPEVFTVCDPFEQHFDLKENIVDKAFLGKTQKMLALFMLRRLKQEVEKLIPEKLETKVYCPLSKVQTFWYKATLMKDVVGLAKMEGKGGVKVNSQKNLNVLRNLFMQLRKCSNHPFLFDGAEVNPEETSLEDLIGASGKLSVLDMLLRSLFQKGHRAVVFTQFTMLLDLIEDYCILRGWKYCRLDGATDRARRNFLLRRFNEPNSQYFLFLMSTKSGGMGLNLQTADTCILFDSDWNPQSDIQAMARVHRIGQRKKVHVYRLVTSGTIEERILERAEKKLLLEIVNRETQSNTTMDLEDPNATARGLSAGELLEDIKFGCEAIFGNSSNNELPSEEDIAVITDRARKESRSVGKLTGGTAKSSNSFNATKNFTQSQVFGGVDFQQVRKQKENELIPKNLKGIAYLWHEIKSLENKKRERKSRICQVEGKGTGYGKEYVPVLTANNYTFCGETSVFDRELKQSNKSNFEVKKRKNKGPSFENTDHCVVCGDGGDLVCCPICPNTVHLSCVGLCRSNDFQSCPHHRCSKCNKNRYHAGGLLYSCNSCPNSYCEDCLPKEGVTFLDKLERFEKLGFDSTKRNVYIHCSDMCENYAVAELGYHPPNLPCEKKRASCPKAIDLSDHFGTSYDLKEAAAAVIAHKEDTVGRGKRNIARKNFDLEKGPTKKSSNAFNGTVEAADNTVFAEAIVISTANAATPGKPNYFVNDSMTPTSKRSQEQQTAMSKTNDTPSTSATEVSSDAYSYCVEVDVATPAATLAGRDARHAIKID